MTLKTVLKQSACIGIAVAALNSCGITVLPHQSKPCDLSEAACLREIYSQPSRYWPAPHVDEGVAFSELQPLMGSKRPQSSEAEITLGEALFFEKRLSADGSIACASCHQPEHGFADGTATSAGVFARQGRRNATSLLHLSQNQQLFFWDGRAKTLEQQALMPLTDPNEMDMTLDAIPGILEKAGYTPMFQTAFGKEIDLDGLAKALAAYQRTLQPQPTRFDAFLLGNQTALSDLEIQGLHLFRTKARCMNCHSGQMLTDGKMHNLNQTLAGRKWQDFGQYEVTGQKADWGRFKTPSLRNLSMTKPWFHHGLFVNLQGVVAIYNLGMPLRAAEGAPEEAHQEHLDPLIKPLGLTPQEREALTRFLETL